MQNLFQNFSSGGGQKDNSLPPDPIADASEDIKDVMEDDALPVPEDAEKPTIMDQMSDFFKSIQLPELPKFPKFGKKSTMTDEEAAAAGTEILERAGVEGLADDDEEKQKKYKKILILIGVSGLSVLALFLLWLLLRGGRTEGTMKQYKHAAIRLLRFMGSALYTAHPVMPEFSPVCLFANIKCVPLCVL